MGGENKELRRAIAELMAVGLNDSQIARRLGKSRQRIYYLRVKQMGLERPDNWPLCGARFPSFVAQLWDIYLKGQSFSNTARTILERLDAGDTDGAYAVFYTDGDKLPGYMEWGRKFIALLYSNLGCRLHRVPNCQMRFCVHQKGGK